MARQGAEPARAAAADPGVARRIGAADPRCLLGRWSRVAHCVDYLSFVRALPDVDAQRWQRLVTDLARLGRCERDACGVVTARGRWGYFLIPPRGFPEMKICFYRRSSARDRLRRLQLLEACFLHEGDPQ